MAITGLEKEEEEVENIFSKMLKLVAYPVSAFSGYVFSKQIIRNATYDNLKYTGAFEDIREPHYKRLNDVTKRFMNKEPVDVIGETGQLHEAFKSRLSERIEEMGLGTLKKQWEFIHTTQKQNAMLTGFTAAGISIGALLTMANNKLFTSTISEHMEANKQQQQDKEPERGA